MIHSYPTIYQLGHRAIVDLLKSPCVIEEKIDGSQFSMCRVGGELMCRSKGQQIVIAEPEKLFSKAVESAQSLDLVDGWIYRCEYLRSPKHNTLAYSRIPERHLMVFDILTGPETYLTPAAKKMECLRIGLECVPCFYDGFTEATSWTEERKLSMGWVEELLHNDSVLGGCKVEGIVIKNYSVFTPEKKIAIAKFVSAAFQEKHKSEWRSANPTKADIIDGLIAELKTEARWNKGVQHLRESGVIQDSPSDIGPLLKEVKEDIKKEEEDYIKDKLFSHFWPQIQRGVTGGLPEWYKEQLAKKQFTPE